MTSWKVVVLPAIAVAVVPVASKNTSSGEIPAARVTFALNVSEPLVVEQDGGTTAMEADAWAVPPGPEQFSV